VDATVRVRGVPASARPLAELAAVSYLQPDLLPEGETPGLEASTRLRSNAFATYSNATHVCTCEVDPDTGMVRLLRYVVSEDCGVMINPMVVEGQIAGGVAQGIGGVLLEHLASDPDGTPLATTFLDYLLPTATDVPTIEYGHVETPSSMPGGFKGVGEGGAIASPAAVINAVADALAHLGVRITDQPLSPDRVRRLVEGARAPTPSGA
jgi:carbon-monoxide dehydrogenase large subunit